MLTIKTENLQAALKHEQFMLSKETNPPMIEFRRNHIRDLATELLRRYRASKES